MSRFVAVMCLVGVLAGVPAITSGSLAASSTPAGASASASTGGSSGLSATLEVHAGLPGSGLPPATLPTSATHLYTPHRPATCPPLPVPSDPNTASPGQVGTLTGTVPWPPLSKSLLAKAGGNPATAAALDRTPVQYPPLRPANWSNQGNNWKLTSARSGNPQLYTNPQELCGVRGISADTAWQVTTGSPKTLIAITDSGIEWCDPAVVNKLYINPAALPYPENAAGQTKLDLVPPGTGAFSDSNPYDLNGSGVVNVQQYAADPRVAAIAKAYGGLFCATHDRYGYAGISPMDLIRTFGTPTMPGPSGQPVKNPYYYPTCSASVCSPKYPGQSPSGFTEAISGWNFVGNTNNPYDLVHYDHGTGEAQDSGGAAGNLGQEVGTCPNCMILPIRVGDSFIAASNTFAEGVAFAVDSGANLVQEALGTIDLTNTARQAVAYAQSHGVPVVASAADEHAQHHNLPALLSHTIVVNSVTEAPRGPNNVALYNPPSYLYLNGCTNYGANIAVSVESASCSSEATGKTSGVVGLAESAAATQLAAGRLAPYPGLTGVTGKPVALSVNEIRQLVTMTASAVDFGKAAPPTGPPDNYAVAAPIPTTRFPTHPGFTPYFGYGRLDASRLVHWIAKGWIPPEAEVTNLSWFENLSPTGSLTLKGLVGTPRACPGTPAGGSPCRWRAQVQVGIGSGPAPGTWRAVKSVFGTTTFSGKGVFQGTLARIPLAKVAALFPAGTNFSGGPVGPGGTPEANRFTFTVRIVVQDESVKVSGNKAASPPLVGMSTRAEFLHSSAGTLFGGPLRYKSSIDAAPTLAPIGPGGENALLVATTDGTIRALLPNGKELPGWPVHTHLDTGYHPGELAYTSGKVSPPRGSPLDVTGGLAVGDLANEAAPCLHPATKGAKPNASCLDVVATDYTGRVYAWHAAGRNAGKLLPGFPVRTNPNFSGPLVANPNNRVLRGIFSAPALAPLQGAQRVTTKGGKSQTVTPLDIVASSMDRHVYAWQPDGKLVPGWPVLVVDPSEVSYVNPVTNQVTFKASSNVTQGTKLMDTPAIGNLNGGSGPPDVVVGANEEYSGAPNASVADPLYDALGTAGSKAGAFNTANSRVYAIRPTGAGTSSCAVSSSGTATAQPDACAFLPGWPVPIADFESSLLPDLGDGITNSPALGPAQSSPAGPLEVGVMSAAGPAYVLNANGTSAFGTGPDGKPKVASTEPTGALSNSNDGGPSIPALGAPIFATLGSAAPGTSLVAPALSLAEALNVAFPGDHPVHPAQVDAWSTTTGHFVTGFPQTMNDMEFFDQPIAADVAGPGSGPYVVEGSATYDIRAVNAVGQEAPGFPKFTGGWMVNSPTFSPFGKLKNQVLAAGTREGYLFVWKTPAAACAPSGPWPMAHHDLWNTNNLTATTGESTPSCSATGSSGGLPGGLAGGLPGGLGSGGSGSGSGGSGSGSGNPVPLPGMPTGSVPGSVPGVLPATPRTTVPPGIPLPSGALAGALSRRSR